MQSREITQGAPHTYPRVVLVHHTGWVCGWVWVSVGEYVCACAHLCSHLQLCSSGMPQSAGARVASAPPQALQARAKGQRAKGVRN